ncbi:polysaccharide deacetylase family protein [Candidatus Clostridium stratigraminis]|uniref:Polysaccharide deacetylase family protein n=1 Tax=Candidatus Clostridium stratigraminis TaxID=3381661 RepID=A0ABW8T1Z4_9CLOT
MKGQKIYIITASMLIPFFLISCNHSSNQTAATLNPYSANKSENINRSIDNSKIIDNTKKELSEASSDSPSTTSANTSDVKPNSASAKPALEKPAAENSASIPKENSSAPNKIADVKGISSKKIEWSWAYSPKNSAALLTKYHGYAFGDTTQKNIYLTFDEGYEYGYTANILDTLKANNVRATFFVTSSYVTGSLNGIKDSDLISRMSKEGHIIGNHSVHHKSMPSFTDEHAFDAELTGVEKAVAKIPGATVSKFFRPPMGDFSELSLYYTQKLGYKTIFFSLAYKDYDVNNQPDKVTAKHFLLTSTKPGMICLLHAESKTNAEILDSLIKGWKNEGYTFKTLNELP